MGTEGAGPAGLSGAQIWLTRQPGCDSDHDSSALPLDRIKDWSTCIVPDPRHGGLRGVFSLPAPSHSLAVAAETAEPDGALRALTAASKLSYK